MKGVLAGFVERVRRAYAEPLRIWDMPLRQRLFVVYRRGEDRESFWSWHATAWTPREAIAKVRNAAPYFRIGRVTPFRIRFPA